MTGKPSATAALLKMSPMTATALTFKGEAKTPDSAKEIDERERLLFFHFTAECIKEVQAPILKLSYFIVIA